MDCIQNGNARLTVSAGLGRLTNSRTRTVLVNMECLLSHSSVSWPRSVGWPRPLRLNIS